MRPKGQAEYFKRTRNKTYKRGWFDKRGWWWEWFGWKPDAYSFKFRITFHYQKMPSLGTKRVCWWVVKERVSKVRWWRFVVGLIIRKRAMLQSFRKSFLIDKFLISGGDCWANWELKLDYRGAHLIGIKYRFSNYIYIQSKWERKKDGKWPGIQIRKKLF